MWLWFAPLTGACEPVTEYIEQLPSGCINWTRGVVIATGQAKAAGGENHPDQDLGISRATANAVNNLLQTLKKLRLNDSRYVDELITTKQEIQTKINEMAAAAKVVEAVTETDGSCHVALEMNLYGGFAQLMLPQDIRQVEPIKPLNGSRFFHSPLEQMENNGQNVSTGKSNAYTGLLVDARGVGAGPAMVPVLLDENGQEVYGPAFVSREYAVQKGLCRYVSDMDNYAGIALIAPNPLRVNGLRSASEGSCNIVISNADASRIRGASAHLEFLKRCRVVIILN